MPEQRIIAHLLEAKGCVELVIVAVLVLVVGVLLGWGTSAALATNIVSMNGLNAVVHNGDGTVTILTGATPLTFDYGTEGTIGRFDVTDGGSGYAAGAALAVEDLAATGGASSPRGGLAARLPGACRCRCLRRT